MPPQRPTDLEDVVDLVEQLVDPRPGKAHRPRCLADAADGPMDAQAAFGQLRDLRAGIGPSAGPCCYEVKDDVREAARMLAGATELFPQRDGRMYFDLWRANRNQLVARGVNSVSIEIAGICTMCRNDMFFSFRREGAGCGHFALMAALVD